MVALNSKTSLSVPAGVVLMASAKSKLPERPGMPARLTLPSAEPLMPAAVTVKLPSTEVMETTPAMLAATSEKPNVTSGPTFSKLNVPLRLWPAISSGPGEAAGIVALNLKTSLSVPAGVVLIVRAKSKLPDRPGMLDRLTMPLAEPLMPAAVAVKLPSTDSMLTTPPMLAVTSVNPKVTFGPTFSKLKVPERLCPAISNGPGEVAGMVAENLKPSLSVPAGVVSIVSENPKLPESPGMPLRFTSPFADPLMPRAVTVKLPSTEVMLMTPPMLAVTSEKLSSTSLPTFSNVKVPDRF
jgi:hypothetical protein